MNPSLVRGIWLMLLAMFSLSSMDAVAKILIENKVHTVTILAIRSVFITAVVLLTLGAQNKLKKLQTARIGAHLARGVIGLTAVGGFFAALEYLPIADAVVVFFTGTLFVAVASVVVLKERFGIHRWTAIVVGYAGVAIAMSPGLDSFSIGYLFALIGSLSYAGLFISGKIMSKTESTTSLVFYFNSGLGIISLALLPFFWTPLSLELWALVIGVAILALIGHFAITQAFSTREASLLAPLEYTSLLWAILFDYALWGHPPNGHTLIGGSIVVLSGLYFLYRERQNSLLPNPIEQLPAPGSARR
ncbi:MAG: DMT family transporter [Granulosicoccaceae bacterium]